MKQFRPLRAVRKAGTGRRQFVYDLYGDGYSVLHPTKGWRRFTAKRLAAVALTAKLKGRMPHNA